MQIETVGLVALIVVFICLTVAAFAFTMALIA